ncbi:L-serine ammonia-lyase [Rhodococcus wratislaviensis]|uniref:L-serine dehydratase n=1 Tax=Rhodococcus wratislaviensis TaxID=44752 RepID=A0AB38FJY7_RHOWR|nr:L-serine ammonia-lyase [Rhodococcus wratislaviensis]REE74619.1 L-serine ammonia-lyase [Rhodococcus wratislaviensis]SPZ41844.1 L-serine ammonia-lyase [Rhodococcus wratislaviensis]
MVTSVFDLFSIGIGPSSSHTVGPMKAGSMFVDEVKNSDLGTVSRLEVDLYGSLAATGRGHGTLGAVLLGLEGNAPDTIDPDYARSRVAEIDAGSPLRLGPDCELRFTTADITLHMRDAGTRHPNTLRFTAHSDTPHSDTAQPGHTATYYSVGGGFVERDGAPAPQTPSVPWPFATAGELLDICVREGLAISDVMWQNECATRSPDHVQRYLLEVWNVMSESIRHGFHTRGRLPGGLGVERRAPSLYERIRLIGTDHSVSMDWLNAAAMAVNEENAGGGRVVTAPTNGAAGVIPAVLNWALRFVPTVGAGDERDDAIVRFLLTSGAIASLVKGRASISGAEMGCQGEVGSACSMAAAALTEMLGGTPAQVENAAEIAIEHNLGLTCDPVGGLVQIPCIERNAVAAVKAVNAAKIAMHGDGTHRVTLDQAIETMRQTGVDMLSKYKETSLGGLAVNVTEC